jgi:hypothetical protein
MATHLGDFAALRETLNFLLHAKPQSRQEKSGTSTHHQVLSTREANSTSRRQIQRLSVKPIQRWYHSY